MRLTSFLLIGLAAAPAAPAAVVEYYDASRSRYFITADPAEAEWVDRGNAGREWVRTGYEFDLGGASPVCRFYGFPPRGSETHFYTANESECRIVRENGDWGYEGIVFNSHLPDAATGQCAAGLIPVFRAYNDGFARRSSAKDVRHRYSPFRAVQDRMVAGGWIDEGVRFCATEVRDLPLRSFEVRLGPDRVRSGAACGADIEELRSCIGFTNIPGPAHALGPYLPGSYEGELFAQRTGLSGGQVFAPKGPAPEDAASGSFVQLRDTTTWGIYFDTRERGAPNLTNVNPIFQFERFAPDLNEPDKRVAPWAGQYDTDVEVAISFEARVKRLATQPGSHAYGHPTLDFFDRRSFIHLYFIVVAFGTLQSEDLVMRDGPNGNVIVSAGFHASQYGRNFGRTSLLTPSPFSSHAPEGTGGYFEFRFDRAEFARILAAARTLEPGLSPDPADYFLDDYHFNNEIAGDGSIGMNMRAMKLRVLRRDGF